MKKYVFGIDVGGTTVKIGLFTTEGEIVTTWEIPTVREDNGSRILSDISAAVLGKLSELKIQKDEIWGIGIGVPGAVIENGIVNRCINLGWGVFNIEEELSGLTGLPVNAANDANVAALGEMWKGGGSEFRNMVLVTLGTGVGGGIIVDGRVLFGKFGAAGEIGHITVNDEETEVCGCGKCGCLEQYVSATGIVRLAKRYLKSHPQAVTKLNSDDMTAKAVFDLAKEGERASLEIAEEFGKILGKGLAAVSCVADPDAFVIGGGVSKAGNIIIELVEKYYKKYAFHASRETQFRLAKLENDAGMYGAAYLMLGGEQY